MSKTLSISSRADFRRWLSKHHQDTNHVWLILYKKASGKQTISPIDALEEALCYGWIDSRTKSIDPERYAIYFTPRRPGSPWSEYNKALALKMLRQGKMTPKGLALLPADLTQAHNER